MHTTELRDGDGKVVKLIYGPGSVSLNLFSWIDAFQTAMLEREPLAAGASPAPANPPPYKMTTKVIADAYQKKTGRTLGILEKGMVALWLQQIRKRFNDGLPRFDDPYGHGLSRDPEYVPSGPDPHPTVPHLDPQRLQPAGRRHGGLYQDRDRVLGRPADLVAVRRRDRRSLCPQLVGGFGGRRDGRAT